MPAHQSITDATKIHEAKQIASATTADAGKVITPSASTDGVGSLRKLAVNELDPDGRTPWTGWAQYADNEYTSSAKRGFLSTTRTKVTIDGIAAGTDTAGLPSGVTALWDTTNDFVIAENANDAYMIRLCFSVESSGGGTADRYMEIELDVGGSSGTIVKNSHLLIRGTEQRMHSNFITFANSDFVANGGTFYITCSAAMDIWDMQVLVVRTHRGA
jgi:hypothetical protein